MFHSWIIVQYKEHCNTQFTWTLCWQCFATKWYSRQNQTAYQMQEEILWYDDSFNVHIILQDLRSSGRKLCLILLVSITAVTMIHLLKCGWCLVTMNASFAHYIYKNCGGTGKICSDFIFFFSAQFWNYSCNRRNNETTYNLFSVTSMIFMIFRDKRPT